LYDNRDLLNDIAILKLEDYLRPSAIIQFACLPYLLSDINTTGIVVGFGDTFPGANRGIKFFDRIKISTDDCIRQVHLFLNKLI
jgi:hypothetical protein